MVMPMHANATPTSQAAGRARTANGEFTRPKMAATQSTAIPVIKDRVLPHITSPRTMSDGPSGVYRMAS